MPHVGCIFQVDWYGFDEGEDLPRRRPFAGHPPPGNAAILEDDVFIGEDDNGGGGSRGRPLDVEDVDLSDVVQDLRRASN